MVAISHHTVSCTYYTDVFREDAVAGLITAAQKATDETIKRLKLADGDVGEGYGRHKHNAAR